MSEERDELAIAMRTTDSIVSVPDGAFGAKVVITMTEETHLYDLLSDAWERARHALALSKGSDV